MSKEERRKLAEERVKSNINNKDAGATSFGKRAVDFEKIGGWKKDLIYRPKDGVNHLDILPYLIKTDKHPQKMHKGDEDYVLDLWVHRFVGASKSTFICLQAMYGKNCPICEAREAKMKDPKATKEEINFLRPKRRCWYNVVNVGLPESQQEVQIFEESHFLFEEKLLTRIKVSNKGDGVTIPHLLDDGRTIVFNADEKKTPQGKHFDYTIIDLEKRTPYPEKILDSTYSLDDMLVIPTYEEMQMAFLSIDEEEGLGENESPGHREALSESRPSTPTGLRGGLRGDSAGSESVLGRETAINTGRRSLRDEGSAPEPVREVPRDVSVLETGDARCPHGYKFGLENSIQQGCGKCDAVTWDACADERTRLISEKRGQ
jgi:hypothetical protein